MKWDAYSTNWGGSSISFLSCFYSLGQVYLIEDTCLYSALFDLKTDKTYFFDFKATSTKPVFSAYNKTSLACKAF
jgi:hypothetical protein